MRGLELFNHLSNDGTTLKEAYLVGKNLFNRDLANTEVFAGYFALLCKMALFPIEIEERKHYANEADIALVLFSENVDMDDGELETVKIYRATLYDVARQIVDAENDIAQAELRKIQNDNTHLIAALADLKGKIYASKSKKDFDELLVQVQQKELLIKQDFFTPEQKELYDTLTGEYSAVVNQKLLRFERASEMDYNKNAIMSFKKVFEHFREDEAKYKERPSELYSLVSKKLFSYDAAKLFNETLVYYNHVYSFIFAKLDDTGKFKLTEYAVDCEKIQG